MFAPHPPLPKGLRVAKQGRNEQGLQVKADQQVGDKFVLRY
jgi:hypothetical protein